MKGQLTIINTYINQINHVKRIKTESDKLNKAIESLERAFELAEKRDSWFGRSDDDIIALHYLEKELGFDIPKITMLNMHPLHLNNSGISFLN